MAPGTAHHKPLQLSPALPTAKLDPPTLQSIQSIPFQTDCVALAWDMARGTEHMELQCELRYRVPEDPAWALVSAAGAVGLGRSQELPVLQAVGVEGSPCEWDIKVSTAGPAPARGRSQHSPGSGCPQVTGIIGRAGTARRCGFLFGTRYCFQMRCRRNSASPLASWSEWSPGRNYTTHEKGECESHRGSPLPEQAAQWWGHTAHCWGHRAHCWGHRAH